MNSDTPIDKTHPLWIAWEKYKTSDEYANTRRWALVEAHVDGSLWASFCEGWKTQERELAQCRKELEKAKETTAFLRKCISDVADAVGFAEGCNAGKSVSLEYKAVIRGILEYICRRNKRMNDAESRNKELEGALEKVLQGRLLYVDSMDFDDGTMEEIRAVLAKGEKHE
jgi:hypothetical protein